jgi:glycosyltransferase 2 family protein
MTEILEKNKTSLRKRVSSLLLQLILPLFLGVFILWLVFRDTNFQRIWLIFKDANYYVLAFSLIFGLMGNTFRAFRWQLLLAPLGHRTRVLNIAFAVYGGYAVNFAIPRAGELWRCGMVSKTENIPFAQAVSTMILDRVMDLLSVISIIFFASLLNAEYLIKQLTQNNAIHSKLNIILTSGWFYIGLLAVIAFLIYIWKCHRSNFIVRKITRIIQGIRTDLILIWRMKEKGKLLFHSVMIWVSYFFYFYVTIYAFDFTENLGFTAALITFTMGSISMAVPTNGGMGAWHAAVIAALMLYGVSHVSAEAFAFGVFALQSLWVIFCGLVGIAGLAINKNSTTKM